MTSNQLIGPSHVAQIVSTTMANYISTFERKSIYPCTVWVRSIQCSYGGVQKDFQGRCGPFFKL